MTDTSHKQTNQSEANFTKKSSNHENAPEPRPYPRNPQTPRDLWEGVQDLCVFTSTTGHHREHRTACEMGGGEGV